MRHNNYLRRSSSVAVVLFISIVSFGQIDSTKPHSLDSLIRRQKGIIGQLAKNLLTDTFEIDPGLLRNDIPFQRYKDRVIRNIRIQVLPFGVPIADTTQKTEKELRGIKKLANKLHRQSRDYVIRNNLFFSENEKLSPYVMGDNEKHLRDLPFLQDAKIRVVPVRGSRDSVDIIVLSKDVLSIGGSFRLHNAESLSLRAKEDNFFGWGDRFQLESLFDMKRKEKFGQGFEYIKRNIYGTFVDGSVGFLNFNKSFSNGEREEEIAYVRFARPLVNRYMKWTYGSEMEMHETKNYYNTDSLYDSDFKYKYRLMDAWVGYNLDAGYRKDNDRWRRLIGLRVVNKDFPVKPLKYANEYYYSYADLQAVLGSFSFFNQNFYKTRYIYGFGRNEDVPEGIEASFTGGYTKKNGRERPFAGVSFTRYYFNPSLHYFNYNLRAGTFFYKDKFEDIDLLAGLDYISRLHYMKGKWKQRFFFSISATRQINSLLSEPLRLESEFGLPDFKNNNESGNTRFSFKGETVFYSPWSLLLFRFAPFAFGNVSYLNLKTENVSDPKLYSSIGGGVRIRNESLIFGTTEFRGMYFPRKNFRNESWRIEVNTSIRFKYNQEFIKRPEFVRVN
ncbi:hypothetical protein [Terrimonas pollutisoli]|uniref:hypothetical protein n=1 Tax=Terrimonas pollutisoli TaxID=3034147 RepID=UPI0023EE1DF2|nr:hypothetical protein [Terrimonas sp. H1YJ31]